MADSSSLFGIPLPREETRILNGLRHRLLIWEPLPDRVEVGGEEKVPSPPPEEPDVTASDSPTLVLLHGFLDLSWSFAPFVAALRRLAEDGATSPESDVGDRGRDGGESRSGVDGERESRRDGLKRLRIIAPDLRGHGATEWVGRGGYYHFPDYVADMLPLLEPLPRPLYLLGHSMGGTVAALLAGAFPNAVDKLVLVEGLGPPAEQEGPVERMELWIRQVRARKESPPTPMKSVDEAASRLLRANARLSPELLDVLSREGTRKVEGGWVWAFDPLHRTRSPLGYTSEAFRAYLSRITVPTLVVEGSESGFAHYVGDDRVTAISRRTEARIENAGHMVHHDEPDALARVVAGFLANR